MALWKQVGIPLLTSSLLLAALPSWASSYKYTMLNQPGWYQSFPSGVNAYNLVVGSFEDENGNSHGFTWQNGVVTQYDAPDANLTALSGINDHGIAGGSADSTESGPFIFTLDTATGKQTNFQPPAGYTFDPRGIDNAGVIIGLAKRGNSQQRIFRQSAANVRLLRQGYTPTATSLTGLVVGTYPHDGKTSAFILRDGKYTTIDVKGATLTGANFVTDDGDYGGDILTPRGQTFGFTSVGGTVTAYVVPNAVATFVDGLGAGKEVVGTYLGTDNRYHGFIFVNGSYFTLDVPSEGSTTILQVNEKSTLIGVYTPPGGSLGTAFIGECRAENHLCTQ